MRNRAATVDEYLAGLSPEIRSVIETVRGVILRHLPEGYEEGMQYGMIGYYVPLSRYPKTYNCQPLCYVALASQKNCLSLYLMSVYGDRDTELWFRDEFLRRGKQLDMGKSCVRFKKIEDLPLDLIGQVVSRDSVDSFIRRYEDSRRKS